MCQERGDLKAMQVSRSSLGVLGSVGAYAAALLLSPAMCDRAHAFGGLWRPQAAEVRAAGVQVLFVDVPGPEVTVLVRMEHEGGAERFAWLIPVPGKPVVGLSSNAVFARLEAATAPEYWVEVAVDGACMGPEPEPAGDAAEDAPLGLGAADRAATILAARPGSVGPYEVAVLPPETSPRDPAAAVMAWLADNGYDAARFDRELLRAYAGGGYHVVALRLEEGADASAIRPVVLTYEGERPAIPIRPLSVSAPEVLRVRTWVVGPTQAVPDNYASLVLNDARIDWLSGKAFPAGTLPAVGAGPFGTLVPEPRNYGALVAAAVDEAGGRGFVTELAAPASHFRDKIWSPLDDENFATLSGEAYADGVEAVIAAREHYAGWDGFEDAVRGSTTLPEDVTAAAFSREPERYLGRAEVDAGAFFQLLETEVIGPVIEAARLLSWAPYLTRMTTILRPDEQALDPTFDYNFDLGQINNVHVGKQLITCSADVTRDEAPWRMELPQGGVVVGRGSRRWPIELDDLPANLMVVMLSNRGSGTVLEDNRDAIARALFGAGGVMADAGGFRLPQNGLPIGGVHVVMPPRSADDAQASAEPTRQGGGCRVARASGAGVLPVLPWVLAGAVFAARRRRPSAAVRSASGEGAA
jgi:hypothetical protein